MLDQLLGDNKNDLIQNLVSQLGLGEREAGGFLDQALAMIMGLFKGGDLDLSKLLGGSGEGLASGLDLGALSGLVGGDAGKAQAGVGTILDTLKGKLTDADDPEGLLGGVLGGMDKDGDGLDAGDVMDGLKKLF
ncbi:MAG: hypothetical protein AAF138_04660 [Planctomycetota bacterium]